MATVDLTKQPTFIDIWKTEDTDGELLPIANELVENNTILNHAVWTMASQKTQHKMSRVAYLPTSSNKRIGVGTAPSAGGHEQVVEETKVRETWIEIEDEELQKSSNPEAYMHKQIALGLQGIMQEGIQEMLYGNRATNPDEINGFMNRLPSLNAVRNTGKVVSAGGVGGSNNSSLLGIKWDIYDGVFFIFPQDHPMAGVDMEVFPAENKTDSNGKIMRVVRARLQWAYGIGIANRRGIFRLANITSTQAWVNTVNGSGTNWTIGVENALVDAFNDAPANGAGFRLYANNFCKTAFDIRTKDKGNVWMSPRDPYNLNDLQTTMFGQRPISSLERLSAAESLVS